MEKYLDWSVVYKIFLGGHFSELTKWKITRMECRGLVPESLAGRRSSPSSVVSGKIGG